MKICLVLVWSAFVLAAGAWCVPAARAQGVTVKAPPEADAHNWEEYVPPGEGFSVLMPGTPRRQTQRMPLGEGQTTPLHIHSLNTATAEYGVIYADYPITVTGPEMAKRILDDGAKGAVEAVNAELLHVAETTLGGRPGRALKEKLPDGKIMRVRLYLDGSRLYQVAITTPDERGAPASAVKFHEETATKFLDSFKLNGTRTQDSAVAPLPPPMPRPTEGEVDRLMKELKAKNEPVYSSCDDLEKCKPTPSAKPAVIEISKPISKPQPAYPPIAKAARAQGAVQVLVIVDEEGKVLAAQSVGGHPLLQFAAVKAAREATFTPTLLDGKPVKISGQLTYNFVLQ